MVQLHYSHSVSSVKGSRNNRTKTPFQNLSFTKQGIRLKKSNIRFPLVHSSSSSTSADQQVSLEPYENEKFQSDYLVSDENWQVRRMVETEDEMKQVANVQAEAFHEPVFLFDDLFFDFFKAEVLSGLLYRLRNSSPNRYACLVAEPKTDSEESNTELVGVVDVTVQIEDSVLQHFPGVQEYLYVSGIAVFNKFRRQKVATSLLKACDKLSAMWGFEYLVLRAYEDDHGAQKLYMKSGYRVVSRDPPWLTSWIGRRRQVVMVKRLNIQ